MGIDQIIIGIVSAAFAGGGAWAGVHMRMKAFEERLTGIERVGGIIVNRMVRIITAHNKNHGDNIDTNKIEG